jgi:methionyl-tRNA formyltransferase
MLRIAFAGTPQFALPTLQALAATPHTLVGVLTQPDRPAGRGRLLTISPVKQLAVQLGVPLLQPPRLASDGEVPAQLSAWAADLLVVVAYGLILPPALLQLPRLGCLNVHASLLPRWRGAAPIQHAILAGDTQTGVSLMRMEAGLDSGPLLAQRQVPIGASTTAAELEETLARAGAQLTVDSLPALQAGRCEERPQPAFGVTYAPKFERRAAHIDWARSAADIDRQIRAFNPRPVAYTGWRGQALRIWRARLASQEQASRARQGLPAVQRVAAGTVLGLVDTELLVLCGDGQALAVQQLQLPGRRPVSAREFAQGRVGAGARFDPAP